MKNAGNFPGKNEWDSVNSTFRWEILLVNGKNLVGYSKNINYPEMKDKIQLLQTTIFRLYRSDYFNKSRVYKINYYLNQNVRSKDLILTLAPHGYIFGNNMDYTMNERMVGFLDRFYTKLKSHEIITSDLIDKASKTTEEKIFSISEKRFSNDHKLLSYAFDRIKEGYPDGRVKDFVIKYRQKYFNM